MLIEDFAEVTRRVIQREGFEDFLPTLCLPERRHIAVLEDVPDEKLQEIRPISLEWARHKAGEEEFLLAIREGQSSFRIIRNFRGEISERVFSIS